MSRDPDRDDSVIGRRALLAGLAALPGLVAGPVWAQSAALAQDKTRVAFMGDSMIDGIWGGIYRFAQHDRCLKDHLEAGRYGKNGTGLTRSDSYDWALQAGKITETWKPAAAILSIGLNDRQDVIEPGGARATYGTPAWEDAYRSRIVQFLEATGMSGAAVMLLGLPALRDSAANADARLKNRLFAEAVAKVGKPAIVYVEPWQAPNAESGSFVSASPGPTGGLIQVRAPDGLHFTAAGYDLVSAYLYPKLVANLKNTGRDLAAICPAN